MNTPKKNQTIRVDTTYKLNDREQYLLAHESIPSSPTSRSALKYPSRTPLKSRSAPFEPASPTENLNKENSIKGSDLYALEPKKTPSKMSELGGVWTPMKKGSTVAAAKLFSSPKSKGTKSLKRKIEKIVENNADSEEDSSDDEDEEFGEEELNEEMIKNTADDEEDDDPNSLSNVYNASQEQYFAANKTNSKTSNNTLAKLPQLELSDFHKIRPLLTLKHKKEIEELNFWHEELFEQWVFELTLGDFNLMFYGYGSKINLISKFVDKYLIDAPVVVVNGFFPSISIREILLQIVQGVLQLPDVPASPPELLAAIEYYFEDDNRELEKLYVVIHNIDGTNLRNEKSQSYLSQLASISNIHLIASIDHINAPLLWDSAATCRFNFVWHDVTNFTPHITESLRITLWTEYRMERKR
ncbi:Origin recognition complex subunit 2 [Nowakowskiella sp. JEL0407]|nr:Origin recognition complex subunit 2 [Nowakowskiella sp. JEL0407]